MNALFLILIAIACSMEMQVIKVLILAVGGYKL